MPRAFSKNVLSGSTVSFLELSDLSYWLEVDGPLMDEIGFQPLISFLKQKQKHSLFLNNYKFIGNCKEMYREIPKKLFFNFLNIFSKDFIYLFLERGEGKERNTRPVTQACTLTGNQTGGPLLHSPGFNPLNHSSQGRFPGNIYLQS